MSLIRTRPKADLIFGASGSRKTSNLGLVAMYVMEKYGKRTRLVTCDGGGFDVLLPLVEQGIVEPWVVINRGNFVESIDLVSQGYWPIDPENPLSAMKPPSEDTWKQFGFLAIEGLTSIGDAIINYFSSKKTRLSQDPAYSYVDGSKTYSGANMSYFGEAQKLLQVFVNNTHVLPFDKVIWTALEGRGEEEGTKAPVYGPAIVGKKSTGKATQWFGNSVHIEMAVTEEGTDEKTKQVRLNTRPFMYLRPHADPVSRIVFPCKTRAPFQYANELPEYLDPPDMAKLYRLLDDLNAKVAEELKGRAQVAEVFTPQPPAPASTQAPVEVTPDAAPESQAAATVPAVKLRPRVGSR